MSKKPWRDVNAIYQIYPRSFYDSNGDGVGDIEGVIAKLDYLKSKDDSLGIDAIWFSPMFPSPQKDCGYDVSDYRGVDPIFGDMNSLKRLLDEAHARDIKVLLDYVPNHSSDQHEWFKEASSSRDNSKRDYYVWRDAKPDGSVPTNWLSMSGGSTWTWHEPTQQYYLHSFLPSQPDLNWDNPVLREEMLNVLRYWMDMGVDGFRADAVWPISKNFEAGDNPMNPEFYGGDDNFGSYIHANSRGGPNLHKYLRMMTDVVAEYENRFIVFEFYPDDRFGSRLDQYFKMQDINPGYASTFFFEGFQLQWWARQFQGSFDAMFSKYYKDLPVATLGNHDQMRIASKFGMAQAKALAVMELTLPGVPSVYYGEELGMLDVEIKPEDAFDRFAGGAGLDARDKYRTPMRWDNSKYAGFSTVKPWLPVGPHKEWMNVEAQQKTDHSFLKMYQKLLRLRSEEPTIRYGSYDNWRETSDEIMTFRRSLDGKEFYTVVNFTDYSIDLDLPKPGRVICSTNTHKEYDIDSTKMTIHPFEAVVVRAKNS
ncbi:DUF3459 domain-containing protein [Candidatus Saccharibacteria bacterium]|nr:DUF3459 domain-containing protein [Candidatus Saccharibacteria bacterium]